MLSVERVEVVCGGLRAGTYQCLLGVYGVMVCAWWGTTFSITWKRRSATALFRWGIDKEAHIRMPNPYSREHAHALKIKDETAKIADAQQNEKNLYALLLKSKNRLNRTLERFVGISQKFLVVLMTLGCISILLVANFFVIECVLMP